MKTFLKILTALMLWVYGTCASAKTGGDVDTLRIYYGSIGTFKVRMFLADYGSGEIVFLKTGHIYQLSGKREGQRITFTQTYEMFGPDSEPNQSKTEEAGYLYGKINGDGLIAGFWKKTKKGKEKLEVSLKPASQILVRQNTAELNFINHNPLLKRDTGYTETLYDFDFVDEIRPGPLKIMQACRNDVLRFCIQNHINDISKVKESLKGNDDYIYHWFHDSLKAGDSDNISMTDMEWDVSHGSTVDYADEYVISVDSSAFGYEGGAHGFKYARLYNYDINTGEKLEMKDLFMHGYEKQLYAIGDLWFRKTFGITKPGRIDGYFYGPGDENDSFGIYKPAENWSFSVGGIEMVYNYYECLPYVYGPVSFTIPYKALKKIIRPDGPLGWVLKEF